MKNNKLLLIAQYLSSAIILILAFKYKIELLLIVATLITYEIALILLVEYSNNNRVLLQYSFLGLIITTVIGQLYLQFKIITDFTLMHVIMFVVNIIPISAYLVYYVENKE